MSDNTQVSEKEVQQRSSQVSMTNVPETIEEATHRIMALEMLVEDFARAYEICQATGNYDILRTYAENANEMVKNKIEIEYETGELKLNVIEGELSEESKEAIRSAQERRAQNQ